MAADSRAPFDFRVVPAEDLAAGERARLRGLFHESYRDANETYLERSLARLRYVATAEAAGELAGFALGETRVVDLPRLARQPVALAGICCVSPRFRRQGLFRELEQRAFAAAGIPHRPRVLSCGRVAHPAAFRTITWNPTHVPKRGVRPTPWQQEMGELIAGVYGVDRFDAETFTCFGSGRPTGTPVVDVDVTAEEWEAFARVDRGRGDSLLGLCWIPDAPDGW